MAELVKSGIPSLATVNPPNSSRVGSGLLAGEAIAAGDACYIKSDGKVWLATGAAATAPAKVRGFAAEAVNVGQPVTLLHHVALRYGAALTPGATYYLSGTVPGGLADAASTGGTAPVAFAIDATRIYVMQSLY